MIIDKNKLRGLIIKADSKNILHLNINQNEPPSLEKALKTLRKFIGKHGADITIIIK